MIVSEAGACAGDLYVRDGQIAAIIRPGLDLDTEAAFDASGLHVLPGLIDAHVHFRSFTKHRDSLVDATRSAAHGGVTTIIGHLMGMNATDLRPRDRVAHVIAEAAAQGTSTDYSFHVGLADEPHALDDLDEIVASGITSFKMFMAYRSRGIMVDDRFMLRAMDAVRRSGALALVHAEAGDISDELEERIRNAGVPVGAEALAASRPPWIEAEATNRALSLAHAVGGDVYFVHVSAPEALEAISRARAAGRRAYAETCPQYLNLTDRDFIRLGGLAKVAPPLRQEVERALLLRWVAAGHVDVIASDHSPYTVADKTGDIWDIPFGAPGTETLVAMTWRALRSVGLDISALARLLASSPARIFGLYPQKGVIAVGSDADFTLVDLAGSTAIDGKQQHNMSGYSLYDGMSAPIRVVASFVRGQPLLRNERLEPTTRGEFISRSRRN